MLNHALPKLFIVSGLFFSALRAADSTSIADMEEESHSLSGVWYFFDDQNNKGNSLITSAINSVDSSTITDSTGAISSYLWDTTSFAPGAQGSGRSLKMAFVFGTQDPKCGGTCTYPPQVGMGMNIGLDITGAKSISFWAKADAPTTINFSVGTSAITDYGTYAKLVSVTRDWAQYDIPLADLKQPSWAKQIPFDPALFSGVGWSVSQGDNAGMTKGTVLLDNVVIQGWAPAADTATSVFAHRGRAASSIRIVKHAGLYRLELPPSLSASAGIIEAFDAQGIRLGSASFRNGERSVELNLSGAAKASRVYFSVRAR